MTTTQLIKELHEECIICDVKMTRQIDRDNHCFFRFYQQKKRFKINLKISN